MSRLGPIERLHLKAALAVGGGRRPLRPGRGVLSITFDDFPKSAWTEAGPVLADHGVKATYYVSGGFCGREVDGVRQFDDEDLQALHATGHEVACHTFDHLSALKTSPIEYAQSLGRNARFFRERLGEVTVESFAYPYGDVSFSAFDTVARSFSTARGILPGTNAGTVRPFSLKSAGLEARKAGAYDIDAMIDGAARRGEWLILFTHDVSDRPTDFGCRPTDLDHVLGRAKGAGLEITTVGEIARRSRR